MQSKAYERDRAMDDKHSQTQMDESYWQALLSDSEIGESPPPKGKRSISTNGPDLHWADDGMPDDEVWRLAQQTMESSQVQETLVVGYNRGGLLVEWKGLRGFVPASHLVCLSPLLDAEARRTELAQRVGSTLVLRIIEIDRPQNRLVFSERAAISNESREQALLAELNPGQTRKGIVTNVCSFGAFVDLGGLEGLIHISEISWGRVNHPGDALKSGQSVEVYVISIDPEQKRVALSLKRLHPDPWATVETRYQVGQEITGQVTNVVSFGAFVRVEEGLEGLIHVSELAEGTFLHPRNVVREGDTVVAHILNIDSNQRRMGLSLRRKNGPGVTYGPLSGLDSYRELST
jgi:small subunit ribosomal protein S1